MLSVNLVSSFVLSRYGTLCNIYLYFHRCRYNVVLPLTPFAFGTGFKLLACPYFSGSVVPLGMHLLPTTLPLPKTTNLNLQDLPLYT